MTGKHKRNLVSAATIRSISIRASSWWDSLSPEQQEGYIEEHPTSKYAEERRKSKDSGGDKAPAEHKPEHHKPEHKPADKKPEHHDDKPAADAPKIAHVKHAVKKFVKTVEANPGSDVRRTFGQMMLGKAKGIVKGLVNEGHQVLSAGTSIWKLAHGLQISEKEKHHAKEVATRLVVIMGAAVVSGGAGAIFAHGITAAAAHLAQSFVAHGLVGVSEQVIMHASADGKKDDPEEGLHKMAKLLADYLENSPEVKPILEKYAKDELDDDESLYN